MPYEQKQMVMKHLEALMQEMYEQLREQAQEHREQLDQTNREMRAGQGDSGGRGQGQGT